ncbi:MAG TPA: winged helix-turn-helix domain-containing protein [Acetobacteraceae bacterium]
MPDESLSPEWNIISFGEFRLALHERRLEAAGAPVNLGSRALAILIALIERAGEIVSNRDLIARVWPKVTVDPGTLRFHMAALRKALGDGQSGARYVTNVPGRGYCFVAPVARVRTPPPAPAERHTIRHDHLLPPRLKRMVGRDLAVETISARLATQRFVTIIGPGGIGKTTVAIAIGHALSADFADGIGFVDLAPLSDPRLVPSAVASALLLPVHSQDPTPGLVTFLRDKHMLLVLDSCEHLIAAASTLAETIFAQAPRIHILATSQEKLRVDGEHVHRLHPLDCPPDDMELTAAELLAYPAAQLFIERIAASGAHFALSDADAPVVARICQKLDGIALAIELAAGRVGAYGIRGTAALLNHRLRLLWHGRRTAQPRHQTLTATLDWSYDLLSEPERLIMRRLSVFVGFFTLEAAQSVAAAEDADRAQLVETVASLVAKSLVSADISGVQTRYRLLETTRVYALGKLAESGETDRISRAHAISYRAFLERSTGELPAISKNEVLARYGGYVGNVRAALEWSFSQPGEHGIATALAAAAASLFLEMSLLTECHRWTERAVAALDASTLGTRQEMELQAALGLTLMFTQGNDEDVRRAFTRALALAEALDDANYQLRLLGGLNIYRTRIGDFRGALALARRCETVARQLGNPAGIAMADWMLGCTHHRLGNHDSAKKHCAVALTLPPISNRINTIHFGFDHRIRALCTLARTLWLQGFPDQAVTAARATVAEAAALDHPVTLCISLILTGSVFVWTGNLPATRELVDRLTATAERYHLAPYSVMATIFKGAYCMRRGEAEAGVQLLRDSVERLNAGQYQLHNSVITYNLAEGLAMTGRFGEALAVVEGIIAQTARDGESFTTPESLRIKGDILASMPQADLSAAEHCFLESLSRAGRQAALSWELRTAISLARLRAKQGRAGEAADVLKPVYDRFTEGFDTADLKAAGRLLDELECPARKKTQRVTELLPWRNIASD